jgi:tRNA modification GTPase
VTGEDLVELHLHGGRAVVQSVLETLGGIKGLRQADSGEFTRRAFENGRIDLSEAEGLADLLAAETEGQRRAALLMAGGALGSLTGQWQTRLLSESARIEAILDFSDEDDVAADADPVPLRVLAGEIAALLDDPPAERLHDGIRVVLAGPPNAGKSSLFNALVNRSAAIVSDIPGTTRDTIEAPVSLGGLPMLFVDTAGLRESSDRIEAIGVSRAGEAIGEADILLWLGPAEEAPAGAVLVAAKADLGLVGAGLAVSALTGAGVPELRAAIAEQARTLLPRPGALALNARHRTVLREVLAEIVAATEAGDLLVRAEHLRRARDAFDRLTGRAGTEDMLDALFGRFCIGK